ncbi:phosphatase PAP2 family protein [Taibaiella lutea]|uniref:Phosphatase PAP2 family protein n=1 Tax=Taibaiella lutea TaxID=2608001 RepID=A0A5M6CJ90_9BACT|nr:phosphatase PAP2 family protein [Taibaiella lutea]KAA5534520.1 phosphatase PAP2 family protein [Taibaiella lutea]
MKYLLCFLFSFTATVSDAQSALNNTDSLGNADKSALKVDSLFKPLMTPFYLKQVYVPAALMTTGIVSTTIFTASIKFRIAEERNEHFSNFHTSIDNYLQYAPIPIAYGLDAFGFKSKNDILNRSLILLKGEALMFVTVNILKYTTNELRPDAANIHSFPSGHTAQAFAAATFLSEEYKDKYPWISYMAYGMAGTTGLLRIANNKHFVGDVLMGAGMGILSMKLSYWTHQYRWGKRHHKSGIKSS